MSSELEAMARAMVREVENAIHTEWPALGFANSAEFEEVSWPSYVGQARAALLAIREPTEAMRSAMYGNFYADDRPGPDDYWALGIDHILNGEPE